MVGFLSISVEEIQCYRCWLIVGRVVGKYVVYGPALSTPIDAFDIICQVSRPDPNHQSEQVESSVHTDAKWLSPDWITHLLTLPYLTLSC